MSIKTVAVVGASGLVGQRVVKALAAEGFEVTAISREGSKSVFPEGVAVRKADLTSVPSLTRAFAGQDAVISAISTVAVVVPGAQEPLIDAAIAAGVKRFLPSEYGLNTRILDGEILGDWLQSKTCTVDYLIEKSNENPGFTWTGVATCLFFDWSIHRGIYGISLENKSITIFDSGNQKVSTTSLSFLAKAIVAVLQHPVETTNKYLNVVEFEVTQNELHRLFEEETGSKFAVTHQAADEAEKAGKEKLAIGGVPPGRFPFEEFLQKYWFGDGVCHAIRDEDKANSVLELPKTELRDAVRQYIREHCA